MNCPVCYGQGLAFDYARGEWGPASCKACGGSGTFEARPERKREQPKEAAMPNKGCKLVAWSPEEIDHLVSFGVKIHCEKYPNRTEKAATLKLASLRAASEPDPGSAAAPAAPHAPKPVAEPAATAAPVPASAPQAAPPADALQLIARIYLPTSVRALGRLLIAFEATFADHGAAVRAVGNELWIEADK